MTKKIIELSSGGVIFKRKDTSFEVVLISRRKGKIWCLPKGHIEEGESLKETAIREVRKETGLIGEVVDKVDDIIYWYSNKDKKGELIKIFKRVYFFLLKYIEGETKDHDCEAKYVQWFDIEKAKGILTYKTEQNVMEKAEKLLKNLREGK